MSSQTQATTQPLPVVTATPSDDRAGRLMLRIGVIAVAVLVLAIAVYVLRGLLGIAPTQASYVSGAVPSANPASGTAGNYTRFSGGYVTGSPGDPTLQAPTQSPSASAPPQATPDGATPSPVPTQSSVSQPSIAAVAAAAPVVSGPVVPAPSNVTPQPQAAPATSDAQPATDTSAQAQAPAVSESPSTPVADSSSKHELGYVFSAADLDSYCKSSYPGTTASVPSSGAGLSVSCSGQPIDPAALSQACSSGLAVPFNDRPVWQCAAKD